MPSRQYRLFSRLILLVPLKLRLRILFFRRFRKILSFNHPISFNEKLQRRKILDRNPLLSVAADKLESKIFVKSICKDIFIPRNIWIGEDVDSLDGIDFKMLPDDYVFKANHTSQTLKIVRDRNHISLKKMKKLGKRWLAHNQSGVLGEWAYGQVAPRLFIEEFLNFNNSVPDDYKFFVYHGHVKFIQLDSERFVSQKRNMYDANWKELCFNYTHQRKLPPPKRPQFLDEMVEKAELIGQHFDFIRVDFYFYKNRVTFGELTVYPGAGFEKFPCHSWDIEFGKTWNLPY